MSDARARRRVDRQHVQPVIEIRAKTPGRDQRRQVGARGRDDPDVGAHDPVRADRLEFLVLQHAQQLALQRQRHVADLVEKQRAAIGQLELADAPLAIGARVRAAAPNSVSSSVSGIAATLTVTSGWSARADAA